MLASGEGISRDAAKAATVLKKACDGSDARACGLTGVLNLAQGVKPIALHDPQRACTMADKFACAVQKRVK
jgi:TPR repeat protein